jgi:hypothetical protein
MKRLIACSHRGRNALKLDSALASPRTCAGAEPNNTETKSTDESIFFMVYLPNETRLGLRTNDRTHSLTASFGFIALAYLASASLILSLKIYNPLDASQARTNLRNSPPQTVTRTTNIARSRILSLIATGHHHHCDSSGIVRTDSLDRMFSYELIPSCRSTRTSEGAGGTVLANGQSQLCGGDAIALHAQAVLVITSVLPTNRP